MADFTQYRVGLHNVGSYMVSGLPYITGSATMAINTEEHIEFPFVTKNFTVINHTGQTIRVHFNSIAAGIGHVLDGFHYIELDSDNASHTFDIKCNEVYISAPNDGSTRQFRVVASLTQIPRDAMYSLTGSGLTDAP